MRPLIPIIAALLLASSSLAALPSPQRVDHQKEYAACLDLAQTDPQRAAASALYWQELGGDLGARHCYAVALMGTRDYVGAGDVFVALSDETRLPMTERSRFVMQASHLFLKAGKTIKARDAINQAITWNSDNLAAFVLRARIAAATGDSLSALKDLDYVLLEDPNNLDALIYRASLYRSLKRYDLAAEALAKAENLDPNQPYVLLERGILAATQNDLATAQRVWEKIVMDYPTSAAATAAQQNLTKLRTR